MYGIFGPRETRVQLSDPPGSLETLTLDFLNKARTAALGRFAGHPIWSRGCQTVQRTVTTRTGTEGCTGVIVAHISAPLINAWAAAAPGSPAQRKAHVLDQLQLVLQDLSDQDMHGYLALTATQCDVYDLDLVQLVAESLERTSFSQLQRKADIHWEGTLVRSLHPPVLVLVVSIGF